MYYNRGIAYEKKGDFDKAIADYTEVTRLDATDADAYYNGAVLTVARVTVTRPLPTTRKRSASIRNMPRQTGTEVVLRKQRRLRQGYRRLQVVILNPIDAKPRISRLGLREQGRPRKAIADFTEAIHSICQSLGTSTGETFKLKALTRLLPITRRLSGSTRNGLMRIVAEVCLQENGRAVQGRADFAQAKKLGYKGK